MPWRMPSGSGSKQRRGDWKMIKIIRYAIPLMLCSFVILTTGCGIHYNVKGRVVDAVSGDPIEGASVAIRWTDVEFGQRFAPYSSGVYLIEKAKDTSDADGYFTIPKYPNKMFDMGVYKKGFVCWSSDTDFLAKKLKKPIEAVKNGMVVKLEPFTADIIRERHASFTVSVSFAAGGLEGIEEEEKIDYEHFMKNIKKEIK